MIIVRSLAASLACAASFLFCARLNADVVSLQPIADTTLIETAPENNLGGANFFNAGTAGNGSRNRAVLLFDLDEVIPAGSIITSATLTMDIVRQPNSGLQNSNFDLRRVLQSWGEGAQVPENPDSPGLGGPAGTDEATWNWRFAPGTGWSSPGGQLGTDFSTVVSASALVQSLGDTVLFESSVPLVADLQAWLNDPSSNFGWVLMTQAEDIDKTARGFASHESGFGPTLTIEFTPIPEPSTIALVTVALLSCLTATRFRRRRAGEKVSR
jgi:hypothetical protein